MAQKSLRDSANPFCQDFYFRTRILKKFLWERVTEIDISQSNFLTLSELHRFLTLRFFAGKRTWKYSISSSSLLTISEDFYPSKDLNP